MSLSHPRIHSEMLDLLSWIGDPPRSPRQTHALNESDCEVLDLGGGRYLATTIDTVSEEIEAGLYRDPHTIGWVAAMASLSDLAAVGAQPLGMLLSAEWGRSFDPARRAEVARGFSEALRRCRTFWLGGDTGRCGSTVLGGVALGLCEGYRPLSRVGMRPGDLLCVTGSLGNGPALALRHLRGEPIDSFAESYYRPVARLEAGRALAGLATCAMDTSDGLLQTVHALLGLNGAGLELDWSPELRDVLISAPAREYCEQREIPLWTLCEAEHGDYELVAAVSPENLIKAKALVPDLHVLGRVTVHAGIVLRLEDGRREPIDPELARSLQSRAGLDIPRALGDLVAELRKRRLP